tara:strand:+ start:2857 stop:4083 length:1227 start_codon:yes stop_codon:yes gene_type:complete
MIKNVFCFYLVISPGLEEISLNEIENKWVVFFPDEKIPEIKTVVGGLEVDISLEKGVLLNQILKIPTRVLLRLKEFKCRDLPKLYNKIKNIDWSPFLTEAPISLKISCHQSRLFHTNKIELTVAKAFQVYFKGFPAKKKYIENAKKFHPTALYIRFDNDICTLSIDTSGEPLYKRSKRPFNGKAPIRENYGAALCFSLKKEIELISKSQSATNFHLIDPMCGSGTFLVEANNWLRPNQERNFSYFSYPCFKLAPPSLFIKNRSNEISQNKSSLFLTSSGYEANATILQKTKENNLNFEPEINILKHDILSSDNMKDLPNGNKAVIFNPPYGKRIKLSQKPTSYYPSLFKKIKEKINPEFLAVVFPLPEDEKDKNIILSSIKPYKLVKKIAFKNGGIPVFFMIFCRQLS